MEEFVEIVKILVTKEIERKKYKNVYIGDVDEIVQQISYLMLERANLNKDSFNGEGKTIYSYVSVLIRSCLVRLAWGRDKYGDGYILQ